MAVVPKTKIYKDALNDTDLFPPRDYHIQEIYDIIEKNVEIPPNHYDDRPDVNFAKWKNYIHSVLPSIDLIESLVSEGRREWHRFK
ncbi:hypothetical protein [Paenibacillus terrae]|uniref:Uncharacterized protein n=1 Tax=Paenibacillus terrae TaxID=159743 RepID=A0A0D7WX91_9BACL|nr:hypothetical protein [Paenibacillus terrae]KJD43614.1 hypothetical protein QD47_21730 [Paenibacillus terrae]